MRIHIKTNKQEIIFTKNRLVIIHEEYLLNTKAYYNYSFSKFCKRLKHFTKKGKRKEIFFPFLIDFHVNTRHVNYSVLVQKLNKAIGRIIIHNYYEPKAYRSEYVIFDTIFKFEDVIFELYIK